MDQPGDPATARCPIDRLRRRSASAKVDTGHQDAARSGAALPLLTSERMAYERTDMTEAGGDLSVDAGRPAEQPDHVPHLERPRRGIVTEPRAEVGHEGSVDRHAGIAWSNRRVPEVPSEVGGDVRPIVPAAENRKRHDRSHGFEVRGFTPGTGRPFSRRLRVGVEQERAVFPGGDEDASLPSHPGHLLREAVMRVPMPDGGEVT